MNKLNELKINKKDALGEPGKEHVAYDMVTMPGHVVKQKHYNQEDKGEEIFAGIDQMADAYATAPDLIAKITKRGADWAIVEKLDTDRTEQEIMKLESALGELTGDLCRDMYELLQTSRSRNIGMMGEVVYNKLGEEWLTIFEGYVEFIGRLFATFDGEYDLDLHYGNIGYDNKDNLKLLDI